VTERRDPAQDASGLAAEAWGVVRRAKGVDIE
jgi:hypothetical protein